MEEKFYYEVSCSAPILGPGEYVYVKYIGESGTLQCFGNELTHGGMGTGDDGVCRDESIRYGLPKAVDAVWVSYTDRKVYKFTTLIPYDTILALFKDGGAPCDQTSDDWTEKIECFDLCFLPGGKAVLYVKAAVKTILLDWSATGEEVFDDKILSSVYGSYGLKNMEEYYNEFYTEDDPDYNHWREYMREHDTAAPLLERYLERFNYTMEFEFEEEGAYIHSVGAEYSNSERHTQTPRFNEAFKMPSRPVETKVWWCTKMYEFVAYMYFNEPELLRAYDEAFGDDRTQKGELLTKVGKENDRFEIFLNVGEKSVKLEKTQIRVFRYPLGGPYHGELHHMNYEGDHTNYFADNVGYFMTEEDEDDDEDDDD